MKTTKQTTLRITLLSLSLLLSLYCERSFAQERTKLMFDELEPKVTEIGDKAMKAYEDGDTKTAMALWSDSVRNVVLNSYVGSYRFTDLNDQIIDTDELDMPLFLQVTAYGCAPCRAEIPALNEVADKYAGKVKIVLLFLDDEEKLAKLAPKYSDNIITVPFRQTGEELDNGFAYFDSFKHLVKSTPTNYLINKNKRIVGLSSGAAVPRTYTDRNTGEKVTITKEDAFNKNVANLSHEIESIMK